MTPWEPVARALAAGAAALGTTTVGTVRARGGVAGPTSDRARALFRGRRMRAPSPGGPNHGGGGGVARQAVEATKHVADSGAGGGGRLKYHAGHGKACGGRT